MDVRVVAYLVVDVALDRTDLFLLDRPAVGVLLLLHAGQHLLPLALVYLVHLVLDLSEAADYVVDGADNFGDGLEEAAGGGAVGQLGRVVALEDGGDLEDGGGLDVLLGVAYDDVKVDEAVLDALLEGLLDLAVNVLDVDEPELLGVPAASREQLVGPAENVGNLLQDGLQLLLNVLAMLLLLVGELLDLVGVLLVDLQEQLGCDLLALLVDAVSVGLELLQLVVEVRADPPARPRQERVHVGLGAPLEPGDPRLDYPIGRLQVLREQLPLIVVHKVYYLVVLSHHHHRKLPQHPKGLPVGHHELVGLVGDADVEGDEHLPGRHLVYHPQQLAVEVALDVVGLRPEDLEGQLVVLAAFVGTAEDGDGLNRLSDVAGLLEAPILVLPDGELLVLDDALELLDGEGVLLKGGGLDLIVDEVELVDLVLELLEPENNGADEDGAPRVFAVMEGDVGVALVLDLLLGGLNLCDEEVHDLEGLLLDAGLDAIALGEVVEGFEHVDALLDGGDLLEGEVDYVLVHHVQLLNPRLECVVLLMPVRGLHVQDLLLLVRLELLYQLHERPLYLLQDPHYLRSPSPPKLRQLIIPALQGKLQLPLADLDQLRAPLHEGLHRGENRVGHEAPLAGLGGADYVGKLVIDLPPPLAAVDCVVKVLDALLHIAVEHVVDVYLGLAALDDLVGNLVEEVGDPVVGVVEARVVPDHANPLEQLGQHVGDLLGRGPLEQAAGLEEGLEEDEVVLGLLGLGLDIVGQLPEAPGVVAVHLLEELDDGLEVWVLELLVNVLEILPAVAPVLNLVEGARVLVLLVGVGVADNLLYLPVPLDDGGLQPLD